MSAQPIAFEKYLTLGPRSYGIRAAEPGDAPVIAWQRRRAFAEQGRIADAPLAAMTRAFEPWLRRRLREGCYVGWLAECDGAVIAGIGVFIVDWPPHVAHAAPKRAYVTNAYVDAAHRGVALETRLWRLASDYARALAEPDVPAYAPFERLGRESLVFAGAAESAWAATPQGTAAILA